MTASATFFVFLGIGAVAVELMKFITWLDQPQPKRKRAAAHR